MQRTEKQDIYTRITNQIVGHLEKGVRPWVRPWNAEHAPGRITRPLRHNGKPYSGINVLSLWASATAQSFAAPVWMTFKQAMELDAHIRKGEKGSLVVYADSITQKETDEKTGDEIDREIPFLKGYTVFNVEQIDGLPEVYYAKAAPILDPVARIEHAEKFFAASGATIRHGGNRAFYSIAADAIQMPPFESFQDADSYYATLAHECTHNAAPRIMPRWMWKACRTEAYPTRLVGIITAIPGMRVVHRRADTVRVSNPEQRLVLVLSL
jgi:antirestriction protein ArdC